MPDEVDNSGASPGAEGADGAGGSGGIAGGDVNDEEFDDAAEIDIGDFKVFATPPEVDFKQRASLEIARWVLIIFAGVLLFYAAAAVVLVARADARFADAFELIKFMINSTLPLVTLAVGYYLGDRTTANDNS